MLQLAFVLKNVKTVGTYVIKAPFYIMKQFSLCKILKLCCWQENNWQGDIVQQIAWKLVVRTEFISKH